MSVSVDRKHTDGQPDIHDMNAVAMGLITKKVTPGVGRSMSMRVMHLRQPLTRRRIEALNGEGIEGASVFRERHPIQFLLAQIGAALFQVVRRMNAVHDVFAMLAAYERAAAVEENG